MESDACEERLNEMQDMFVKRGYPLELSEKNKQEVMHPQVREERKENKIKRISFVRTFHPLSTKVDNIIKKHWFLLKRSFPEVEEFMSPPLICNKRLPNLRDKLVRADMGSKIRMPRQQFLSSQRKGTYPCLHCSQCTSIIEGDKFHHPHSGQAFTVKGYFTCKSKNVIYLIKCPCGLLYIGETTQAIRDRIGKTHPQLESIIFSYLSHTISIKRDIKFHRLSLIGEEGTLSRCYKKEKPIGFTPSKP